ncbi:MAG: thioredoxin fold domain-containing protein [Nevskia sp.]|nr:thioredoxin fold domain-containing protein [Nevskia sp.]
MSLHLLLLRLTHLTPGPAMLARVSLALALGLLVQQLLLRRNAAVAEVVPLRTGLLSLPLLLGVALLAAWLGYPTQSVRQHQLDLARSAPVRLAYGPAGAPAIQVFTAPGCGPCRLLEERLGTLIAEGYAVEYIPVSMRGDEDWDALAAAMCSANPRAAFEQVYAMAAAPTPLAGCDSRVRENAPVLQSLVGEEVYPTVVMPDGLLRVGAPSEEELRDYLRAASPLPGKLL